MTSENKKITQPNNPEQTVSQVQKVNLENLKRILNGWKTTLPSLRNIERRTVKAKSNKVYHVVTMNNITDLTELIYAGAKLV